MKEKGLLNRLHRLMLIRSPIDWLIKPGMMMVLIVIADVSVRRVVFGTGFSLWQSTVVAVGISLPFIIFAFLVLTHMAKLQEKLTSLALTDMLTGLPNRRAFLDKTRHAFLRSHSGYLLILDADHFKRINDEYGHAVGDLCLQAVGAHIQSMLKQTDPVGRIGGEEFGIFLQHRSREALSTLGQHLVGPIAVPLAPDQEELQMTLSVGATNVHHLEPVEVALERADAALYRAKNLGRARMIIEYRPRTMRRRAQTAPSHGTTAADHRPIARHHSEGENVSQTGADILPLPRDGPGPPVSPDAQTPLSAAGSTGR